MDVGYDLEFRVEVESHVGELLRVMSSSKSFVNDYELMLSVDAKK